MKYKIIDSQSPSGLSQHVLIEREDGSFKSFPVDETNPEYLLFLEEIAGDE